jgi:hypothetical protein
MSLVQQTGLWFVEHLGQTFVAQQNVAKVINLAFIILFTPKAGAKQEFNKPA